jgi:DNA polymerase III subunit gamma/tau
MTTASSSAWVGSAPATLPPTASVSIPTPPQPSRTPAPTTTEGSLALAPKPSPTPEPDRPQLVPQPEATPSGTLDLIALQQATVAALESTKGHQSAADTLADATFTLDGDTLQIEAALSKTMLPVIFNAEAERVIKTALRDHAAGHLKLKFHPGTPSTTATKAKPRAPRAGSAADLAEKHPVVQEAKRLFSAELSNVIDLRDKN